MSDGCFGMQDHKEFGLMLFWVKEEPAASVTSGPPHSDLDWLLHEAAHNLQHVYQKCNSNIRFNLN